MRARFFLGRIETLVHQIRLSSNVPRKHALIDRSENACSAWRTLINGEHNCRCSGRRNTDLSPRQTPFAEKV